MPPTQQTQNTVAVNKHWPGTMHLRGLAPHRPVPLHLAAFCVATAAAAAVGAVRAASRYSAFDSGFDPADVAAARQWREQFASADAVPRGTTTYARSSGPGGQHVNKTETKATTAWAVDELAATLPVLLRPTLRGSRYFRQASDSLTISAQAERSRSVNAAANRQKLYEELVALYEATVPGEARAETAAKYEGVYVLFFSCLFGLLHCPQHPLTGRQKSFHEARLRDKKKHSSKKQARRGSGDDG